LVKKQEGPAAYFVQVINKGTDKQMRKLFTIMLVGVFALSTVAITGCGGKDKDGGKKDGAAKDAKK